MREAGQQIPPALEQMAAYGGYGGGSSRPRYNTGGFRGGGGGGYGGGRGGGGSYGGRLLTHAAAPTAGLEDTSRISHLKSTSS